MLTSHRILLMLLSLPSPLHERGGGLSLFRSSIFTGCQRSLEHELFEVVVQDGVLDVPKHQPDVLRVDGGGEVVVQGLLSTVAPLGPEAVHHERLDVRQAVLRSVVLGKVVLEGNVFHFLLQQIRLVEE